MFCNLIANSAHTYAASSYQWARSKFRVIKRHKLREK